ncbi:N-acetyl-gamma-glutamyl-phosphate reductase [Thaumasiovibrio sp. DFM-14]|uniref:N-acetyl-gamma-glutamyl-phosphate reductase n=1 Tax=Thaumasiovibrio sp. DFM-14 TaxID=3384792 RepID=UPI0039A05FCE
MTSRVSSPLQTIIVGGSGYTGAELAVMVERHPGLMLSGVYVSANSADAGKSLADLHGQLRGIVERPVMPLTDVAASAQGVDVVFLATAHEVSHALAPQYLAEGCTVFDLSGAYRVPEQSFFTDYYGFEHQYADWLEKAVYGLAEWHAREIENAQLVAVPGCYPTASQLALRPLISGGLIDAEQWPVINAVSGVSGAGRKASMTNSFCEVSLHAYGVFSHRHQPEISHHLSQSVIFTPHLGNFKRGILATITAKLAADVTAKEIEQAMQAAYADKPFVRLLPATMARIQDVERTPFCDIGWSVSGQHIILTSAIDNLLKGASSQAMQCLNLRFGFAEETALI